MKKFVKVLIIIIMVAAIAILSISLYNTNKSLEAAKADIEGMAFTEGKVIESTSGGVVTVSLKKAVCFESDDFITKNKASGKSIEDVFCDLHKTGLVMGFDNNLVKLVFSKQIVVKEGGSEKCYYLVGDYYVALQK